MYVQIAIGLIILLFCISGILIFGHSKKPINYEIIGLSNRPSLNQTKYNGYFIQDNVCNTTVSNKDAFPYIFINQDPNNTYTFVMSNLVPPSNKSTCEAQPLTIATITGGQTQNWTESGNGTTEPYVVPYVGSSIQVYLNGQPANININGINQGTSWEAELDASTDILSLISNAGTIIGFIGKLF